MKNMWKKSHSFWSHDSFVEYQKSVVEKNYGT